ncbi:Hypothetical protein FKW44_020515 [Caligus rogercresseyi]|uniref:Uncharacterized protein n=1 Tax=Caligus rogercresseyi TaxID=217165 RepID=A0A7T8JYZ3_CALRO|nr:Hypothetical protein FKW44_020515 [Caligus rogercresseyi]
MDAINLDSTEFNNQALDEDAVFRRELDSLQSLWEEYFREKIPREKWKHGELKQHLKSNELDQESSKDGKQKRP